MRYKSTILLILTLGVWACDNDNNIVSEAYEPQLCVYCNITVKDTTVRVAAYVTRTLPYGSSLQSEYLLPDAEVLFSVGNQSYNIPYDPANTYYEGFDLKYTAGKPLSLEVRWNGLHVNGMLHQTLPSDLPVDVFLSEPGRLKIKLIPCISPKVYNFDYRCRNKRNGEDIYWSSGPNSEIGQYQHYQQDGDGFTLLEEDVRERDFKSGDTVITDGFISSISIRYFDNYNLRQWHLPLFLDGIEPGNKDMHYNIHGDGFGYLLFQQYIEKKEVVIR